MKSGSILWLTLLFLILCGRAVDLSAQEASSPILPAYLSGTVTNAITGIPIIGAKITVNNQVAWSVFGGNYTMQVDPVGTFPVKYQKPGFDTYNSSPVTFQSGVPVTMNINLWENLNPPFLASSILDTSLQIVNINWQLPRGNYERLYDDGTQENFTIWALQGNMNAVRFTPVESPSTVNGGSIHIGTEVNYPPGSNPFIPFQVAVYDNSGPQGMPGNQVAGPFDVIPANFGWNEFTFPTPVNITTQSFYLVMIQGGNTPNAAGLAIDNSSNQLRSVTKFVTSGGTPWLPAGCNFMIRAILRGPGGPVNADSPSKSLLGYKVYRLQQGEEQNPSVWIDLGTTTDLFFNDPSWVNLPCGPYRWGIKTVYSGSRYSQAKFSNILGKCWTINATITIELSCEEASQAGAVIQLCNLVYPDTVYTATVDTSGQHIFSRVWKGSYKLTVKKFGYQDYSSNISLAFDTTVSLFLLQKKPPPTNLQVDAKSLSAQWLIPTYKDTLFSEDWSSGSFQTNDWTRQGGANWIISSVIGNPTPSAMFSWSPGVQNYSQTLSSKSISGLHSPILTCSYDIVLDNFATTTLNQMAVEIWDGSSWTTLKNYSNSNGDFPWTNDQLDISAYTDEVFKLRFRAYGEDSYDINAWNIDNIKISAIETSTALTNCVLGYNFYLDNVLSGYTPDIKYIIPGPEVEYGQDYNACVLAVYGSGYSTKACVQFTSEFLYPPRNLSATPIENNVFLQWEKPSIPYSSTPPGLIGYKIFRNNTLIKIISHPDSLNYYDFNLEPGTYHYEVSARYDLTEYGFPGLFDESMRAGPVIVELTYGRDLPFFESWDQASFAYNDWRFYPTQGNWIIDVTDGIPPPTARFNWEPIRINYSFSMESPVLDATPFDCAKIWLDFDLKLETRYSTGQETLIIEIYYNNMWHRMTEYPNVGMDDWQTKKIDISAVAKQAFRVRFNATGANSSDILGWFIDNVHIYPVCYPPKNLEGEQVVNNILLTWSPPGCEGEGGELNQGFEETLFPPIGWDQTILNSSFTWYHSPANSSLGVHSGNYSAGIQWDYFHQDEWLIARNILVTGPLIFWSHAFQGSIYNDHYYVEVSPDGGSTWDVVLDLSDLPAYPSYNGYNLWETPYEVDMTTFLGQTVDIAWHAVDGDGQGLWYSWAIDDCSMGSDAILLPSYDIFRSNSTMGEFTLVNPMPLNDTSYLDENLLPGEYQYYVKLSSPTCLYAESSDTITMDVITSINQHNDLSQLSIYPNPVNDLLHVLSSEPMVAYRLTTSYGQIVEEQDVAFHKDVIVVTRRLAPGLYLLTIETISRATVFKIVVSR